MAYLQVSQLRIHGEDSWWQLFDLVTIQVPSRRIFFPDLVSVKKKKSSSQVKHRAVT